MTGQLRIAPVYRVTVVQQSEYPMHPFKPPADRTAALSLSYSITADALGRTDIPFIITTVAGGDGDIVIVEWFLMIRAPGFNIAEHCGRDNIRRSTIRMLREDAGIPVEASDLDYFERSAKGQMLAHLRDVELARSADPRQAISDELKRAAGQPAGESSRPLTFAIVQDAEGWVQSAWERGDCTENLRWIRDNTRCQPLRELLQGFQIRPA